jgi:hypothetical protein
MLLDGWVTITDSLKMHFQTLTFLCFEIVESESFVLAEENKHNKT